MRYKPWPIVILAAVLILMPVINTLVNAAYLGVSPATYVGYYFSVRQPHQVFAFFFMLPIAGIAVFAMKRWSYPVFLAAIAWALVDNLWSWRSQSGERGALWLYLVFFLFNLVVAVYYLLPTVRKVYFDRALRWWESKPRFLVSLPGDLRIGGAIIDHTLRDFSEGGAFVVAKVDAEPGDEVEFRMSISNFVVDVPARIVHKSSSIENGFGLQFRPDGATKRNIRRLVRALRILGLEPSRDPSSLGGFSEWGKGLLHGKGWVPQV